MSTGPARNGPGHATSTLPDDSLRDIGSDGAGGSHAFASPRRPTDEWIPTPPIGGSKR